MKSKKIKAIKDYGYALYVKATGERITKVFESRKDCTMNFLEFFTGYTRSEVRNSKVLILPIDSTPIQRRKK